VFYLHVFVSGSIDEDKKRKAWMKLTCQGTVG